MVPPLDPQDRLCSPGPRDAVEETPGGSRRGVEATAASAELTGDRQPWEERPSTLMVAALEWAFARVREQHADLAPVVITVGAGAGRRGSGRLGHFAASRWRSRTEHVSAQPALDEIFIAGEGMRGDATDVLGTVLHEAAHALAHARGVQDTSRQGRYHNHAFRDIAGEIGLAVARDGVAGWTLTSVPDATAARYSDVTAKLDWALKHYRRYSMDSLDRRARPPRVRLKASETDEVVCRCACGRHIKVSSGCLASAPIFCGRCAREFRCLEV